MCIIWRGSKGTEGANFHVFYLSVPAFISLCRMRFLCIPVCRWVAKKVEKKTQAKFNIKRFPHNFMSLVQCDNKISSFFSLASSLSLSRSLTQVVFYFMIMSWTLCRFPPIIFSLIFFLAPSFLLFVSSLLLLASTALIMKDKLNECWHCQCNTYRCTFVHLLRRRCRRRYWNDHVHEREREKESGRKSLQCSSVCVCVYFSCFSFWIMVTFSSIH